jgi:peptidoglycan/LPS O-acetylase OafA/YrhL
LSGFLITALLLREWERFGSISLAKFYARRALRIMPALIALLGVYAAIALWKSSYPLDHLKAVASSGLFVMNWVWGLHLGPVGHLSHTWSLGIEEQFYLLWPAILLALCMHFGRQRLATFIAVVIGTVFVWRLALVLNGADVDRIYGGFDTRLDALFVGCLLATVPVAADNRLVSGKAWMFPALLLAFLVFVTSYDARWYQLGGLTLIAACSAWLLGSITASKSGGLTHALRWPPLVALGKISYGFYLWHWLFISLMLEGQYSQWTILLAALPLTILAASISYVAIERPFLRLKDAHFSRSPAVAPLAVAVQYRD